METNFLQTTTLERYQLALEAAGIGVWDHDLLKDTISFSGNSFELFGLTRGTDIPVREVMGRIHPADREQTLEKIKACLHQEQNTPYENEYRVVSTDDGTAVRWIRSKGKAYFTEIGTPFRFTGTIQDISTEVKARETRQKLLALVDNSIELMSILESDQTNSYLNKAGMEMLGFDNMEQVHRTPISELHAPEDIAFVQANVLPGVMNEGRWSGVMNVRHLKTGEIFPVYNNTIRIHDTVTGEPIAVGAVMRDMRPEMATHKALEESEKNFRTLVMQAPVGICIIGANNLVIEMANESFLDVANKKGEDIIGKSILETFPEATSQGFDVMFNNVVKTGQPLYGKEVQVVQERNGQTRTIYVDFTFHPLYEADGSVSRVMDVSIDVTDKVLAKKKLLESEEELQKRVAERTEELERKNRELEEFTYVSSHDLKEPIRKIKMFRELIREKEYDKFSEASKQRFDKIGEAVERMGNSLKDLLDYASLNKAEKWETVDLNKVVRDVESDLELLIAEKQATIKLERLPEVIAVPHQMHQLFYNLLNNSLKFSKKETLPRIDISLVNVVSLPSVGLPALPENHCCICIRDNGIGFEQDKMEKIFVMFQRLHTREEYDGTGIGLAMCKKVVQNHRGQIWAKGEPQKGAAFYFTLPLSS
jgi:PAS domain S-box-containing protein